MHGFSPKMLVRLSLLAAAEVVLSRFLSIPTPIMKIGLSFMPVALCAMLYGPVWAAATAAAADVVGALLFPIGPYFPGFTLSAALTGAVFGLFLYRRAADLAHIAAAVAVNVLIISLLLNTLWLHLLYGGPYAALLPSRLLQACVMAPVQLLVLRLLALPLTRYLNRPAV